MCCRSNATIRSITFCCFDDPTMTPRSFEFVIGMMGILFAQASFVPIDPMYPETRVAMLIHDIDASTIVVTEATRPKVPVDTSCAVNVICATCTPIPTDCKSATTLLNETMCVFFTSGSTGKPKVRCYSHINCTRHILL